MHKRQVTNGSMSDEFHLEGKVDVFLYVKIEGDDVYRLVEFYLGLEVYHRDGDFGIHIKQV